MGYIDHGFNSGPFTIQGNSNLQRRGFILNGPTFLEKILNFGNVLLGTKFWQLATNFICTHLHDMAISVSMHACVGLETLRDQVWSNVQEMRLLFPRS